MDQAARTKIALPDHPITKGLTAWEMTDETYKMKDAYEGSEILLTVDHPNEASKHPIHSLA